MPRSRMSTSRQSQSSTSSTDDNRITDLLLTMNLMYQSHIHPLLPEPLQPISNYISNLLISASPFLTQFVAIFKSVISSASSLASGQQDNSSALLSLGILLITLYTGLKIMNYVRRSIMGWVWLAVKMVLVLFMVQVGWYANSYGWERAAKNIGWIGSIAWGMLEDFIENQNGQTGGQQKQPRGMRQRGQSGYTSGQRAGGRGRWT